MVIGGRDGDKSKIVGRRSRIDTNPEYLESRINGRNTELVVRSLCAS
jgi:hypothetical protein